MIGKTNIIIPHFIETILSIPEGFLVVEYIESDGKTYIDTKVRSHSNMSCEMRFLFLEIPADGTVLGFRRTILLTGDGKNRLYFYHYYLGPKLGYGAFLGKKASAEINQVYNVKTRLDVGHQYMYVNNSLLYEGFDTYYIDNDGSFHMFALNANNDGLNSVIYHTKVRMYYCKIWEGDQLIRNYVPVRNIQTEELGLYDLITREFYTNNAEEGSFTAGPDCDLVISNNNIV